MDLVLIKKTGALIAMALHAAILVWAVTAYRRKQALPDRFWQLLTGTSIVTAVPVLIGLLWLAAGRSPADGMHIFYGSAAAVGTLFQVAIAAGAPFARSYRSRPLIPAFAALFVLLIAARAWMSA